MRPAPAGRRRGARSGGPLPRADGSVARHHEQRDIVRLPAAAEVTGSGEEGLERRLRRGDAEEGEEAIQAERLAALVLRFDQAVGVEDHAVARREIDRLLAPPRTRGQADDRAVRADALQASVRSGDDWRNGRR